MHARLSLSLLALLPALSLALSGCPGTINADGTDGFTVSSGVWVVASSGGARSHSLIATSVGGYCGKAQTAEQNASEALDRHQQRLDEGMSTCESTDLLQDDLASAYNPLYNDGASYLTVVLARDVDSTDQDVVTAPEPGSYAQLGGGNDGSFVAIVNHYSARIYQQIADAYDCEDLSAEEMEDTTVLSQLFAESQAAQDFPEILTLSAAEMEITEPASDKREVRVSGDVIDGGTSVGSMTATFTATECDIEYSSSFAR